jgi:RNA polymerase sigma-70 factor, ECF subfamily
VRRRPRPTGRPASPISIATGPSWRPPSAIRSSSTPSIAGTWPAYYELGDHHDAEDATERTFLAALTSLDRFEERARPADGDGASTFRVWLFQIARNAVARQRRGVRRHPQAPLEAAALVADPLDIERGAATRDEAADAWRAVGNLPADRRRALVLRFVEEMSTAEIAGVLGKSEGAVRVLIHRALRTVARDLGSRGSTSGDAGR